MTDDTPAAASVNAWFDVAFREMDDLILPMFASEADMAGDGKSEISQQYAVTCNNDAFFSILLTQTQVLGEQTVVSLSGQVFAMSGEYLGNTLTLRGLLGVGESSTQIAEAIVADVYKRVQSVEGALNRWPDMDRFMRILTRNPVLRRSGRQCRVLPAATACWIQPDALIFTTRPGS